MMTIQIIMTHHKKEEFLLGAIEFYMKKIRTVEERWIYSVMVEKNHTFLIIDQFMVFSE